jgi:hypothetical protein
MSQGPPIVDARIRDAGRRAALADGLVQDADAARAIAFAYAGPTTFRAGELARFTLRFTARAALPRNACIAVAHRWPNDWGPPQCTDAAAADYLEARAERSASVRWWTSRLHTWHPFDHATFVELPDGLADGASVELRFGDGAAGSPGFRAQTFIEAASPFSLRWQAAPGAPWVEFARHAVAVVGSAPERLVVTAPSLATAGQPFDLHVRAEDRWGNPAKLDADVHIAGVAPLRLGDEGWTTATLLLEREGVHRIEARTDGDVALSAISNPIEALRAAPRERIWWGDLHGQSIIGCGARSIDAYFAHARDFAATDVGSHQANCFLVSGGEWRETQASTRRQQAAGRFVTLLGVEWSGASNVGGDHNLYFPGDEAPLRRCSHEFLADKSDAASDLRHVEDVYGHYRGSDTLIAVHVGGRTADLAWHEPGLDRLIEVHSTHATSEWFLFDALRRGYRMGVIAGSDGVDGRPGNSHPGHMGVRNVRGGLTAILAPALTRDAIWAALKARRCYATTGERILLDFHAGDARMGDEVALRGALPPFRARVEGTAPIERVDFFRGAERLDGVDLLARAAPTSNRVRVAWRGASAQGNWQRARMEWDGELRVAGARIADAAGWAFDTPDEGIVDRDATRVRWRSVTAGDWDGVVVELDAPEAAELTFASAPMNLRVAVRDVPREGRAFEAAGPERVLELRRLPAEAPPWSFDAQFSDPAPLGDHAYWVRVRQTDGAYAWSTPIFVRWSA